METVKVDINKLQLLNDRIVQVIEALNQVRMSAHGVQLGFWPQQQVAWSPWSVGIGQTAPMPVAGAPISPWTTAAPFAPGYAQPSTFGAVPRYPYTVAQPPLGAGTWPSPYAPWYGIGTQQFGTQQFGSPIFSQHPIQMGGLGNGAIDGDSQRLNRFA